MPVIRDPMSLPGRRTTIYPAAFAGQVEGRIKRALTGELGLTQFGVNVTTLEPGASSSLRHWHEAEDEAVYVLTGTLTLVTDDGEETLQPGMVAGFPAGVANGHHLVNRGSEPATYLEIGTRAVNDAAHYPDVDLRAEKRDGQYRFYTKAGVPYG